MKRTIAITLSICLLWTHAWTVVAQEPAPPNLTQIVAKPYLDLLVLSTTIRLTLKEVEDFKRQLEKEKETEKKRLEQEEKQLKTQIEQARKQLDKLNKSASRDTEEMTAERRRLHCLLLKLEGEQRLKQTMREQGLPVAYNNKRAKLDLITQWPAKKQEIAQFIAQGRARERRYGDVEDIGIRKGGEGQKKDVKPGQDAINELMPPEVEDKELVAYVRQVADNIAVHSDLKIPLKLFVLDGDEINAFALPGGFLFINTRLIEKADNESELAGVIVHELAHVTARHGEKLMKRATIASIIYQAAQVAAMIFTGGVVGIGTYYALQYGFFGLGMVLNLALLGVSREYEAEADQLGVQYAWAVGYDPKGFITFFDKMVSEKGYVRSTRFFRTHPSFFDRIVSTISEIVYLPPKESPQVDSSVFQQSKEQLTKVKEESQQEKKKRPTLRRLLECDDDEAKKEPLTLKE